MNPIVLLFKRSLKRRFDQLLDDPNSYYDRCCAERAAFPFPEMDMVMVVFPLLAYAALAARRGAVANADSARMESLVQAAIAIAGRHVKPVDGSLERLADYQRQGVYLGLLNLALSVFLNVTSCRRFESLHAHLCALLHTALVDTQGQPLWSYPDISWPFDSVACVLSLALRDKANQSQIHQPVVRAHLAWMAGIGSDSELGLPWSWTPMEGGSRGQVLPRGGALALTIPWLWQIDAVQCQRWYRRFVKNFWQQLGPLGGFREWPKGYDKQGDIDSGPIVLGFGTAAMGFGLAATLRAGDWWRSLVLSVEFLLVIISIQAVVFWQLRVRGLNTTTVGGIRLSAGNLTGFLFGDACLFMAVTLPDLGYAAGKPIELGPPISN